jgi:hypothetical protein
MLTPWSRAIWLRLRRLARRQNWPKFFEHGYEFCQWLAITFKQ